jgi:hypothetical protein
MLELLHWLKELPGIWALFGVLLGGIITAGVSWVVFRKYGSILAAANERLVSIQKEQIGLMENTLTMQKAHYEAELKDFRAEAATKYEEMKGERDTYRQTLHAARGEMGAEITNLKLTIKDFEARPDVSRLFEAEKEWHRQREAFYERPIWPDVLPADSTDRELPPPGRLRGRA